jgi:hypothetical protein
MRSVVCFNQILPLAIELFELVSPWFPICAVLLKQLLELIPLLSLWNPISGFYG